MGSGASVDRSEIARFSKTAEAWWDASGPYGALHRINPLRLRFIRDEAMRHFSLASSGDRPLKGLSALDIGCGGGLLCEPMARMGADVTGIDPASDGIAAARDHARLSGLAIDYRDVSAEALAAEGTLFDMVLAMEVIEHVVDPKAFVATAARLVRPGGLLFAATINRTLKSFALAIVGAEYVLRWVPRGTHRWEKFVTPGELEAAFDGAGFAVTARTGVIYNPLGEGWQTSPDMDVNYMMAAREAVPPAKLI